MKLLLKKAMLYAGVIGMVLSCATDTPEREPKLSVPPVHMDHVSSVIQFGEEIAGKVNPAFEYILSDPFQWVLAAEEGTIIAVVKNTGCNDYEIRIQLNADWMVIYDHVTQPAVAPGDEVVAGQVLGKVGEGNRVELQLNAKDGTSYCPFSYASSAFIKAHKDFIQDWCIKETVINKNEK